MAQSDKKSKGKGDLSPEEIINQFQVLRGEQRIIANKLSEARTEIFEYKLVIDTLKDVEGDRKCYHAIGGILCEKTVKDVLPKLVDTSSKLEGLCQTLEEQLTKKGIEINEFKQKHQLVVKGQDELNAVLEEAERAKNASSSAEKKPVTSS
ncbi:unnamed protein product [Bemisia tabaci]|uniref:Prefoldin subunit 2 n=1 Tax=Bemisia tabaci TaxID=7038 RepID=A0A9P0A7Q5_BEMTA|nr:PREDICTED: prefoldin subunit 2 [Bemisia tabaci]CAH0388330.1 unnamed protein product [Bemisia tabaci]